MQQARNFYNARKRDRGILSVSLFVKLLLSLNKIANKDWVRLVPAAAVIPAVLVGLTFIGSKTSVAGLTSFLLNYYS